MGFAEAFAYRSRRRRLPRARRAVGVRERRHARFRHRRRSATISRRRLRRARAGAMAAARGRARAREQPLLRRRRLLHARPQGAVRRAGAAGAEGSDVGRLSVPPQHRPHPRPVAHHDAHRQEPAARRRICRSRSSRCIRDDAGACGLSDGGFARVATAHGACVLKVDGQRRPAARLAVRADPLERRDRLLRARRRAGRAAHRSLFRPAGSQGDAGRDRAGRVLAARLRAARARRSRCRPEPGGRASRSPDGIGISAGDQSRPDAVARFRPPVARPATRGWRSGSRARATAPRPSSTASSTAALPRARAMRPCRP